MEKYIKFLRRLPRHLQLRLITAISRIAKNNLAGLDVKQLEGGSEFYRCRVGKIRIIFAKKEKQNVIIDVGFRGNIYK